MKLVRLNPDRIFYRFHRPKWASMPASGAGAAATGGRFNRPGTAALYLAADPLTALAEFGQGTTIVPPGTLVAYQIDIDQVAELAVTQYADAGCDWKYLSRIVGRDPPSWRIADGLLAKGRRGLLYPSIRHAGGLNLVLFLANLDANDRIAPHDPQATLPRDQSSWPPSP